MPRSRESLTSPRRILANERQASALEMRKKGMTYLAIALSLGYRNAQGACEAISAALRKTLQRPANELRLLELERLDCATKAVWPFAMCGDPDSIKTLLKIMERRAKLIGLDLPLQVEITDKTPLPAELTDTELDEVIRHGRLLNARAPGRN